MLLEGLQFAIANIGNGPIVEVGVNPVEQVVTLARHCLFRFGRPSRRWPNKQINEMLAPLVNQSCYGVVIEIIEAPTNQREAFAGKIHHGGRKIELSIKPWFDGVLIGGWYVCEMISHKRTHMTGDKLRREKLIGTRASQHRRQVRKDDRGERTRSAALLRGRARACEIAAHRAPCARLYRHGGGGLVRAGLRGPHQRWER